jgi:hypothetical protein
VKGPAARGDAPSRKHPFLALARSPGWPSNRARTMPNPRQIHLPGQGLTLRLESARELGRAGTLLTRTLRRGCVSTTLGGPKFRRRNPTSNRPLEHAASVKTPGGVIAHSEASSRSKELRSAGATASGYDEARSSNSTEAASSRALDTIVAAAVHYPLTV